MSKSLPQPWLRTTALELLSINGKSFPNHRPRAVQVIRTNEQLEFIVINDKENCLTVFLTAECLKDLREQQGIVRLTDLKNSVIKLENFHFSSTVQSGGNRDVSKFDDHNVSYPFALQCNKLVVMGGDDCDIMGNPVDLNKDKNIRKELNTMHLSTMTQRLATKQFPQQNTLPNSGMLLSSSFPVCSPFFAVSISLVMLMFTHTIICTKESFRNQSLFILPPSAYILPFPVPPQQLFIPFALSLPFSLSMFVFHFIISFFMTSNHIVTPRHRCDLDGKFMYALLPEDEETSDDYLNIPPEQLVCDRSCCDMSFSDFVTVKSLYLCFA